MHSGSGSSSWAADILSCESGKAIGHLTAEEVVREPFEITWGRKKSCRSKGKAREGTQPMLKKARGQRRETATPSQWKASIELLKL